MNRKKDKSVAVPKQLSKEMLYQIWEANGVSKEEIEKMKSIFESVTEAAHQVREEYKQNPSDLQGAVDLEKGLVSGSGVQIHSEALPEDENIEWDLIPKLKSKDIKSAKTKKKK